MTFQHGRIELRVEIVAGDVSLHRMFAALHRKGATIENIRYTAASGIAIVGLVVPAQNAHKLVATLAREPTIGRVEILSVDTVVPSSHDGRSGPE